MSTESDIKFPNLGVRRFDEDRERLSVGPSSEDSLSDDSKISTCQNGALSSPDSLTHLNSHADVSNVLAESMETLGIKSCAQSVAEGPVEYVDVTKPFLDATKGESVLST